MMRTKFEFIILILSCKVLKRGKFEKHKNKEKQEKSKLKKKIEDKEKYV